MPNHAAQPSMPAGSSSTNSGGHFAFTLHPSLRHTREHQAVVDKIMVSDTAARAFEITLEDAQNRVLPRLQSSSRRALSPSLTALLAAVRARDVFALHTALAEAELALYALIRGVVGADLAAERELATMRLVLDQARELTRGD